LWPGAGFALAAKRLNADNRADHAAVHIDITHMRAGRNEIDSLVDTAMNAEGEAVVRCIDAAHQFVQPASRETHDVEYRTEYLTLQLANVPDLDQSWRHKETIRATGR